MLDINKPTKTTQRSVVVQGALDLDQPMLGPVENWGDAHRQYRAGLFFKGQMAQEVKLFDSLNPFPGDRAEQRNHFGRWPVAAVRSANPTPCHRGESRHSFSHLAISTARWRERDIYRCFVIAWGRVDQADHLGTFGARFAPRCQSVQESWSR
ncbi:hypothetical protein [Aurantimonas marianensis]|uniref:Uncharacterized protein n=1 Tax=Aurantimonas marianensis TaxID=2920428 RepID=A0A9X2KJS8_9HYPH|nr:hypothetical protein [Aurantimonas marianensis]MCP3056967.1 hypothetical protein [Aurantimonas marianensis]